MAHSRYIAIAGNIGAGKTELTGFLGKKYGLDVLYEPNDENPYLADFYQDMRAWAFRSQLFFLAHKFKTQLGLEAERRAGTVIRDRTVYEDAEIFAKQLYRQRCIERRDWETYWAFYESIRGVLRPPALMIYLRCPVRVLSARIRLRGRKMEQDIPVAYLRRLNALYEEWIAAYSASPVLVLETDRLDYVSNLVDRVDLFRQVEKHL